MRPENLNFLFKTITTLPGIGPKLEVLFNKLTGKKIVHLLWHLPYNIIERKMHENIHEADIDSIVTIKVKIVDHQPSRFKRQPYTVKCFCGNVNLNIVFFFARHPYIKSKLPIGEERFISGKLEYFRNSFQITHPTHIIKTDKINELRSIEPIYGLTAGLTQRVYLKNIEKTLQHLPDLEEWIDKDTLKKFSFKNWKESLLSIHNPTTKDELLYSNRNRRRLAYDELLAQQLSIAVFRNFNQKQKGIQFIDKTNLIDRCLQNLPFSLTQSQNKAWKSIYEDLISPHQMVRLLQGDVGCGKTIVAVLGMVLAVNSKHQSVLMAPTSILAQQHFENISILLSKIDINIILLTGKDKGKSRQEKLELIKNGKAQIIIGTHALIQDDVIYKSIGLVVIDEQHRFGVFQRMAFTNKGQKPSLLVMSATPIPRTLALAAYGDMDETRITEKPIGRLPIETKAMTLNKEKQLIERLKNKLSSNEKAYWVCPLIEESEELDLQAATERYKKLEKIFKNKVLLIHGQLKENEKETIMKKFKEEDYLILVATTVIEVGIDVKEATTLIVEHAERFGLAQLHQLRGRVGRNNIQSTCILLYKENLGETAKKRIKTIKETNDGFQIAEQDLKIRGPGELLGKKQSGLPTFLIANLSFDADLLDEVRRLVELISLTDPNLKTDNSKKLRNLLYLFEKDIAIKTLLAG